MFEYIVLGFLMICPMNGYQIKQFIGISMVNFMDASFGSIYPTLKRLQKKGMISSEDVVQGGKLVKMYTIEDKGKEAFLEWLKEPVSVANAKQWHLVKLFFFDELDEQIREKHFEYFVNDAEKQIKMLDELSIKGCKDEKEFHYSTLLFGKRYYTLVKEFYKELLNNRR